MRYMTLVLAFVVLAGCATTNCVPAPTSMQEMVMMRGALKAQDAPMVGVPQPPNRNLTVINRHEVPALMPGLVTPPAGEEEAPVPRTEPGSDPRAITVSHVAQKSVVGVPTQDFVPTPVPRGSVQDVQLEMNLEKDAGVEVQNVPNETYIIQNEMALAWDEHEQEWGKMGVELTREQREYELQLLQEQHRYDIQRRQQSEQSARRRALEREGERRAEERREENRLDFIGDVTRDVSRAWSNAQRYRQQNQPVRSYTPVQRPRPPRMVR